MENTDWPLIEIDTLVRELRLVPRATWQIDDPARRPHISGAPEPTERRRAGYIQWDDSDFDVAEGVRWEEKNRLVDAAVSGRLGGESGSGIDALAWYVSFHADPDRWGIYLPLSSLAVADNLYFSHLPLPRAERIAIIEEFILNHEYTHFCIDYACAWFELIHHAPIVASLNERMRTLRGKSIWSQSSNYLEVEETLANGVALKSISGRYSSEVDQSFLDFIRLQPAGYRDGERSVNLSDFRKTLSETLRSYLSGWSTRWNLDLGNTGLDLTCLLPSLEVAAKTCQVWIVDDLPRAGLSPGSVRFFQCVAPIEETTKFRRALSRLHIDRQRAWARVKSALATGIPPGADFKRWERNTWSVRVDAGFRAHLNQPEPGNEVWTAFDIGSHKRMGHG